MKEKYIYKIDDGYYLVNEEFIPRIDFTSGTNIDQKVFMKITFVDEKDMERKSLTVEDNEFRKNSKPLNKLRPLLAYYDKHTVSDIEENPPVLLSLCVSFKKSEAGALEIIDPVTKIISPHEPDKKFEIIFYLATAGINLIWGYPSELERDIIYNRLIGLNNEIS